MESGGYDARGPRMGHRRRGRYCRGAVLLLGSLFLLLLPLTSWAELRPAELERLLAEERYEEAYELALEHRGELEGELRFDFLYGRAAVNAGELSEGIFALERVVMRRPGFAQARLELARAYYLSGEDIRARHHFDAVLAQDPPAPVVATIERFQQRMQARADRYATTVTGHMELGAGYDSNVNSATADETVDVQVFGLTLPVEVDDEKSDSFVRSAGELEISRPVSPSQTLFARGDFELRNNWSETEFSTQRYGGRVGTIFHGDRVRTTLAARAQQFRLDSEAYQNLYGLSADVSASLGESTMLNAGLQGMRLRYADLPDRDSDLGIASAGLTQYWSRSSWRPVVNVTLFGGREDADESTAGAQANTDRDLYGINGLLRLEVAPEWSLTTRAQYRHSEYDEENALFDETRDEDYYQVSLALDWNPSARWNLGPRLEYRDNDANIELFDYQRTVFELRARYSFF